MTSTLDDFAAFYQMHLNGGTYRHRRILSDQSTATMHTRQAKLELLMAGPYGNDYGLAFFLDKLDEKGQARVITHPGLFGTTPWLDEDRELVGVAFSYSPISCESSPWFATFRCRCERWYRYKEAVTFGLFTRLQTVVIVR